MFLLVSLVLAAVALAAGQQERMTFFITSVGKGDGANLGGLAGADAHCGQLAADAGANSTGLIWRAYLSANGNRGGSGVNARDRIGAGPWFNARGVRVASDVTNLHTLNGTMNMLGKTASLTERGAQVNGKGDSPNTHDMLTGSTADGVLIANATCNDWTSNAASGFVARLGHHDKDGGGEAPTSWNSAHLSRGCSQPILVSTGGAGLFYCFALPGTSPTTFTARTTSTRRTFSTAATTTTTTAATTTRTTRFPLRTPAPTPASTQRGSTSATTKTTLAGSNGASSSTSSSTTSTSTSAGASGASGTAGATFGGASSGASSAASLPDATGSGESTAAGASDSAAQVDSSAMSLAVTSGAVVVAASLLLSL